MRFKLDIGNEQFPGTQHRRATASVLALAIAVVTLIWLHTPSRPAVQAAAESADATFVIQSWDSNIKLADDGSVDVTHQVDLALPAGQQNLNLLIPTLPAATVNNFSVQEEQLNNLTPIQYNYTKNAQGIDIVMSALAVRQHILKITYQLGQVVTYQHQSDLLALDLLPLNYKEKISFVSATITLPEQHQLAPSDVSHNLLSTSPYTYHNFEQGKFLYAGKDITSKAGFTIQAFLPKGYLQAQRALYKPWQQPAQVAIWLYPLFLIAALIVVWWRREPTSGPKTRKVPSPGLLAFLSEEKISGRALAATVFSLAQQGHIKIASQAQTGIFSSRQSYYFVLLKSASQQLKPHEHLLLHSLFGQDIRLRFLDFEERVQQVWPQFQQLLYEEALANRYFKRWPSQERLRHAIAGNLLLLPPLFIIIASLTWPSLQFLLLPGWSSLLASAILLNLTVWLMPTKTLTGLSAYRQVLSQIYALTKNGQPETIPLLGALGMLQNWRSLADTPTLATPAWYQDTRLTGKSERLHRCLIELYELLAGAAPKYSYRHGSYSFHATTVSDLG